MKTIFDVAETAGVSVVTVSRLMNNPSIVSEKTAKKIYRVMEQLNYQPSTVARSLMGKNNNTIGVIMPDIKNTFFNNWFRFIEEYANNKNVNLFLCNTDEDPAKELKYVKLLHSQRVDGIIIAAYSKKSVDYLGKSNMRFVLFDRMFDGIDANVVITDHYAGAFEAVEYLIGLGHKKISVLKGPGVLYADIQRYAGFVDAMKKHHLPIENEFVVNCEFSEEMALHEATKLLHRDNKPTAFFTFSGLLTIGVIKCVQQMQLSIPNDISLVGFDEIPGQDIFLPKITHILQDIKALGKNATLTLFNSIQNPLATHKIKTVIKPTLIRGDSCKEITPQ
jgi:LacI family transcriptional regulator